MPTALGYPINSLLLKNNTPLFTSMQSGNSMQSGGKGKKQQKGEEPMNDYENLGVPAGLICVTETKCMGANAMGANANAMGANAMGANANAMGANAMGANAMETDTIPDGLYEQLLALAETNPAKKLSRRHKAKKTSKKTAKKTAKKKL